MKKAFLLNGAKNNQDFPHTLCDILVAELKNSGWDTKAIPLYDTTVASCLGCGGCSFKTPGICLIDDAGREITQKFVQSDLVVYLTPVTFGGYSSELKKAIDRLLPLASAFFTKVNAEIHRKLRYDRLPYLLAVGTLASPDEESIGIFQRLVERNAINLGVPGYTSKVLFEHQALETIRADIETLISRIEVRT